MSASRPDAAGPGAPGRRVRRVPAAAVTATLRRGVVVLIRWVIPSVSLVVAAIYVWAAVVWQANPPAIPIVGRSMQPTLWAGDLVLVRSVEPASLRVGDVITVRVPAADRATWGTPEYVTHRIVKIDRAGGGLAIRTRGDNNKVDDPFVTRGPSVHGRQVLRVPKLGMVVLFFMSRQGLYSVAGFAVLGILWLVVGAIERRRIEEEDVEATLRAVLDEVRHVSDRLEPGDRPTATPARPPARPIDREPLHPAIAVARGLDPTVAVPVAAPPASSPAVSPPPARPRRVTTPTVTLPPLAVDVRGRAIIVAGATGRMGGAVARALHAAGARLTLTGRDPERLQELLEELPGALVVRADLQKPDMPEKLVARALRAHGSLHGIVNAAAIRDDGALLDASDAVLADVLAANVLLPIRLIRAAAPHLESGGFICNLGARPPAVRGSGATVQATARATMAVMSSVLEWELADRGVRMLDVLADAPTRRGLSAPVSGHVPVRLPSTGDALPGVLAPGEGSPVVDAVEAPVAGPPTNEPPNAPALRVVR